MCACVQASVMLVVALLTLNYDGNYEINCIVTFTCELNCIFIVRSVKFITPLKHGLHLSSGRCSSVPSE